MSKITKLSDKSMNVALNELIQAGWMEKCGKGKDGEQLFRLTDAGIAHVENELPKKGNP